MSVNKATITTIGGRRFDPTAPEEKDIVIEDIAHSLSLLCRANGHFREFFSVGRHCLNCAAEAAARGYGTRVELLCLLHDATEAYMSDMTRPLKRQLPYYRDCEERLFLRILHALDVAPPTALEAALVKEIDDCMLYHEFRTFNGDILLEKAPDIHIAIAGGEVPLAETKAAYLARYHALRESLRKEAAEC